MTPDLSIYFVTDSDLAIQAGHRIVDLVGEAIAGGVTALQVREKNTTDADVVRLVEALVKRIPSHVAVIINDRVTVFEALRERGVTVAGVHVGQSDMAVDIVRERVGPDAIIGLTTSTPEQVAAAERSRARIGYVGIGSVHQTPTKGDAPTAIGVDGVIALAAGTSIPAVAIGGITPDDLPALRAGGISGAAVVSWICSSSDPRTAASELAQAWASTD